MEEKIITEKGVVETLETPTAPVIEEKKADEKKQKKSKARKIANIIFYSVFGTIAVCAAAFIIYSKVGGGNGMIGDTMFPAVLTDSMCPDYPVNSVLIVKKVRLQDIKIGDDITFKWDIGEKNKDGTTKLTNMTHRISNIVIDTKYSDLEDPKRYKFTAHGINKESEFCGYQNQDGTWHYMDCTSQTQTFNGSRVVGRVERVSPFMSGFYTFVKSPFGLITIILVPCMYIVVTCVIDMFKKIPDDDNSSAVTAGAGGTGTYTPKSYAPGENPLAGLSKEDIERLKKEMLSELLDKKGGNK